VSPPPSPDALAAEPAGEAADPAAASRRRAGRRGKLPLWLLGALVLILLLALVWQFREARRLEGQVAGLEQALRESEARLGAHRDHLSEIRTGVHDLVDRLEGLRTLVDADPGEPPGGERAASGRETSSSSPPAQETARPIPPRLPQR
jgi:hypothetical protein